MPGILESILRDERILAALHEWGRAGRMQATGRRATLFVTACENGELDTKVVLQDAREAIPEDGWVGTHLFLKNGKPWLEGWRPKVVGTGAKAQEWRAWGEVRFPEDELLDLLNEAHDQLLPTRPYKPASMPRTLTADVRRTGPVLHGKEWITRTRREQWLLAEYITRGRPIPDDDPDLRAEIARAVDRDRWSSEQYCQTVRWLERYGSPSERARAAQFLATEPERVEPALPLVEPAADAPDEDNDALPAVSEAAEPISSDLAILPDADAPTQARVTSANTKKGRPTGSGKINDDSAHREMAGLLAKQDVTSIAGAAARVVGLGKAKGVGSDDNKARRLAAGFLDRFRAELSSDKPRGDVYREITEKLQSK
jgi:hypothetical protein